MQCPRINMSTPSVSSPSQATHRTVARARGTYSSSCSLSLPLSPSLPLSLPLPLPPSLSLPLSLSPSLPLCAAAGQAVSRLCSTNAGPLQAVCLINLPWHPTMMVLFCAMMISFCGFVQLSTDCNVVLLLWRRAPATCRLAGEYHAGP